MEAIKEFDSRAADIDLAYQILKAGGEAKGFKDLVIQVFTIKGNPVDNPQLMAELHTQLNIDSRFVFMGHGTWALKEWSQSKVVRRNITPASLGRSTAYRHRSLQDEFEQEDGEAVNSYDKDNSDEEDEWEE